MFRSSSPPYSVHDAEAGIRLLAFIYRILRVKYGYQERPALPFGLTPEDLAANTLASIRNGTRKIDPARPLNQELFDAARSAVSSLHRRKDPKLTSHDLDGMAGKV